MSRPLLLPAYLRRIFPTLLIALVALLYGSYIAVIIANGRGAVDYETFMSIGHRFRAGEPVYTENSYYPLPYVSIFALFDALPHALSILLWHSAPVAAALLISRGRIWPLLFAPLFAHVVGGQSALFALLGLAVYRRYQAGWRGGIGLALLMLKPQLAFFPLLWAGWHWLYVVRRQRRIPPQAWVFVALVLLLYVPAFLIMPDWVSQWLAQPRPLFMRALAGLIPRSLYMLLPEHGAGFWFLLVLLSVGLLASICWWLRRRLTFDLFMLWSFVVNPFVHDYDLIQMIPLLDKSRLCWLAVLASMPLWFVIFFAYNDDNAWFAATLIAPTLLLFVLRLPTDQPPNDS